MRLLLLILFIAFSTVLSLSIGATHIGFTDMFVALFGKGEEINIIIMQDLRAPRTLLAIIIGAGLGASGAALQSYTQNPLADPGILGFSSMAALGAISALYFGKADWLIPSGLLGAFIGAILLLGLAGVRKSALVLVLAGVGLGALATALSGLLMNFSKNPWALSEIVYWLMGSLKNAGYKHILITSALSFIGLVLLFLISQNLRVMTLGEQTAQTLGVNLVRVKILLVIGVALLVGSGVAVAGAIGFIGLFVPHILRFIFGADPVRLIPLSALGGAGFLAFADSLTRIISFGGTDLYVGILSSLIGAPFFIWLAFRGGR